MSNYTAGNARFDRAVNFERVKEFHVGDRIWYKAKPDKQGIVTEVQLETAAMPHIFVVWDGKDIPESYLPTELGLLKELTPDEERDRVKLEQQVESAFVVAGVALTEIRDRRLYRSTHKTFEAYCKERFQFNRMAAHFKIAAAATWENLYTNGIQKMPTSERQVRELSSLEAAQQVEVWNHAVEKAEGKVPSGRQVKESITEIVRRRDPEHQAQSPHKVGSAVRVKAPDGALKEQQVHNGCIGIVEVVSGWNVEVFVGGLKVNYRSDDLQELNYEQEYIDVIYRVNTLLANKDLDPLVRQMLKPFLKQHTFSQTSKNILNYIESQSINN